MKYKKHIFICTNQRPDGKECCGEEKGMALVQEFKASLLRHGVKGTEVRAQRAGCIDVCSHGPALVVYPEGVFYGKVSLSDVDEIVSQHIKDNKPVERLVITF